jgi:hypothetical protein
MKSSWVGTVSRETPISNSDENGNDGTSNRKKNVTAEDTEERRENQRFETKTPHALRLKIRSMQWSTV